MRIDAAQAEFSSEGTWLNTASYGLPPRRALDALAVALDEWRTGRYAGFGQWDEAVGRARAAFARLVGVPQSWVAIGHQVSPLVGMVAAAVPDGAEVLCADDEFTSVTGPFEQRRVTVRRAPRARLAELVDARTELVAVSVCRGADDELTDLDAVAAACRAHGSRLLVDATQACGWLPIDASSIDYLVVGAYKWLCCPRGVAFLVTRPDAAERLSAVHAGWYAAHVPLDALYDAPLPLAPDARRFDTSPAWHLWVAAAPALELLGEVGVAAIHEHDLRLAQRLRAGLGIAPGRTPIVSLAGSESTAHALAAAGVRFAHRAGRIRLSVHLLNTDADIDRVLDVLDPASSPRVARSRSADTAVPA